MRSPKRRSGKEIVAQPQTVAAELYSIQGQIAFLQEQEKECKEALMSILKKQGVKSVKMENGVHYIRIQRDTLLVKDEAKAKAWMLENIDARAKLDTSAALLALRTQPLVSKIFGKKTTEFLQIKK